jgi:signal transduction histidine kinase
MEEIINTLLTATKFESGELILQKKATNIRQLIETVMKKFSYKTKVMDVKFVCPDSGVSAFVDPDELKKVIRNLLSNAYKFAPENSEIIITLTSDEKSFMISVKDHGIGISVDEKDKIFDKFYRTDRALTRKHGGIGFGLYVSKLIVEQHGGNIWVESEPGNGSTFYVRIPKQ